VPTGENFSTVTRVVIRNVMTGMCADIPWYGKGQVDGVIQQYGCNASSGDNQRWDLIVHQRGGGPGGASPFTIRNSTDRLCMDLPGSGAAADRSEVKENNCRSGGDNQMWFLDERSNGRYWIRNLVSGHLCLDVAEEAGSGGEGAKLTIHPCSPSDDHLWSFSS
jgi:hypothetical protein